MERVGIYLFVNICWIGVWDRGVKEERGREGDI